MTAITKTSISTGILLILLAVGFYIGTGMEQKTALIPAGFGVLILLFGFMAKNEKLRMMAAHIAALVGVLGVLGGFGMGIPKALKGNLGVSVIEQLIMGAICLLYVIACVRSFIAAKKARG